MTSSLSGLPTLYSQFIYKSRYARWLPEENRREDWAETVARYMDFMTKHLKENFKYEIGTILHKQLFDAIYNLEVMPSMRALMTAGEALEKYHVAGYNCCYLSIDHPRAFDEILYILMNGTGVGFSVEQNAIDKLPVVNEHFEDSSTTIIVDDSKGGWAKAFRELIAMLYAGQVPTWDLTKLRPAGARLKTFGGRSSGPAPLDALFKFTVEKFRGAAGRKLTPLEAHDIVCKIADIVVVGGVRRSALISLSNLNDRDMQDAKSGRWWDFEGQRALANNSATYTRKPDVLTFLKEWTALIQSQSGERGIFNRDAAKRQAAKNGRRDPNHQWGTNPSLRKGTKVWTSEGIFPIEELQDKEFTVTNLNGEISPAKCWLSGKDKPLWEITLAGGHKYYATAEHKWPVYNSKTNSYVKINTPDIKVGSLLPISKHNELTFGIDGDAIDGFFMGWNLGDGWITERPTGKQIGIIVSASDKENNITPSINSFLTRYNCTADLSNKNELNINNQEIRDAFTKFNMEHKSKGLPASLWSNASEAYRKAFIDGLFSSDGCFSDRILLTTSHEKLAKDVSDLLGFYGIKSSIKVTSNSDVKFPNGKEYNKTYTRYDLQISHQKSIKRFAELFTITHTAKASKLQALIQNTKEHLDDKIKVISVIKTDLKEDVWDISVDDKTHCFALPHCITGNCSEIILRPNQFCNLSEVVVRHDDTYETLAEKVRLATILGTFQSTLTDFKYLRKIWKDNTEEERLLGVSMTGIMDNDNLSKEMLNSLKQVAITTNVFLAAHLKINPSTAITCVKPSGTVSQLVDSASGIHPRHSEYYIRTVRGDKKDPLTTFMIAKGIPNEPCVMKPNDTVIFSFPQKAPEGAVTRNQLSSIRHLQEWLLFQRHWCEHKPSVTINVKDADWLTVGAWVYDHFDEVSGISFLPHSEHTYKQAPYQECTKEEYEALLAKMPEAIDWTELSEYEKEDTTTGTQELSCVAGYCEVINIGA